MKENNLPDNKIKNLTEEQLIIIQSGGDTTINAVAGSGKTTTLIEYAATRPATSRILYLAFNKSVKQEAVRKFAVKGLNNVRVETAHSLAYRYIMHGSPYKIKQQGYKTHEISDLLNLKGDGARHSEYILANHINKFITYFCNSDKARVQDLNYIDTVFDTKARQFVHSFYKYIEEGTRLLLARMDKAEIGITHDFYLKKFQLLQPQLPYDFIFFDEGQDASAAMLDVFLRQKGTKIIVGDINQQIYGWRYAVNSLQGTNFPGLTLSNSFRFPQDIANLANAILAWKSHLFNYTPIILTGKGSNHKVTSRATIGRSNLGLLLKAIEYVTQNTKVRHIYFEGNIHSYTYADDGASLYDVLNLYNGKHDLIRDKLIRSMNDMSDLEQYIETTEDAQLSMMVGIVNEYGNEIPGILRELKELHTGDEEREKAEMIFSTVHRAKGMEYDEVFLVNDFITESKLEKLKVEVKENSSLDIARLNEEINLLYVAITRAKCKLHIPESLLPKDFKPSVHIEVEKTRKDTLDDFDFRFDRGYNKFENGYGKKGKSTFSVNRKKEKAYSVEQKKESFQSAYKPWTPALDEELKKLYESYHSIGEIARHFGRTKGAIAARLKRLNYEPNDDI